MQIGVGRKTPDGWWKACTGRMGPAVGELLSVWRRLSSWIAAEPGSEWTLCRTTSEIISACGAACLRITIWNQLEFQFAQNKIWIQNLWCNQPNQVVLLAGASTVFNTTPATTTGLAENRLTRLQQWLLQRHATIYQHTRTLSDMHVCINELARLVAYLPEPTNRTPLMGLRLWGTWGWE